MLPPYLLGLHQPPPGPAPTLTVMPTGRVYLSKALAIKLNLQPGQPAEIQSPGPDCPTWQLDLRPTAPRRICWYRDTLPRIRGRKLPVDLVLPNSSLTLALASTPLTTPGCYPLLRPVDLP
jgi:hypothetical protein